METPPLMRDLLAWDRQLEHIRDGHERGEHVIDRGGAHTIVSLQKPFLRASG